MVENGKFLKRLRKGHLEKSAVTGVRCPSRSPKTAKTPAKVHLRLRFQNLGKPRTAGLCGRVAGACDCGPLSCAKIERPSPLRKLSCKVRLFAPNRSRKYRQKVTITTLFQTAFHRIFQSLAQTPHVRFHGRKRVYTLGFQRKIAHSGPHGETGGISGGGGITTLGAFHTVRKPCVAGYQNGKLCRFGILAGRCSRRTQKAFGTAMRLCVSLSRGVAAPQGCVIRGEHL